MSSALANDDVQVSNAPSTTTPPVTSQVAMPGP